METIYSISAAVTVFKERAYFLSSGKSAFLVSAILVLVETVIGIRRKRF